MIKLRKILLVVSIIGAVIALIFQIIREKNNFDREVLENEVKKCNAKVSLLDKQINQLRTEVDYQKTENNESKIDLEKCSRNLGKCTQTLVDCEERFAKSHKSGCRNIVIELSGQTDPFEILNRDERKATENNCDLLMFYKEEHIFILKNVLPELKASHYDKSLGDCVSVLKKCEKKVSFCKMDLSDYCSSLQ